MGRALAYLWSGWGAVASLFLFLALWDLGNRIYGSFILPSPLEAFAALGMSWKVVVMAELLSTPDGVGAGLAAARINLDTAQTLAWILAVVGTLLAAEYLLLEPIKRYLERWRDDPS